MVENTYLVHVASHCSVSTVAERFIFKVELHLVVVFLALNEVEKHFDSALRNWLGLMRLREFHNVTRQRASVNHSG